MCPNAIKTGMPLGSEEFVVEMEKKLERRLLQRPKGRPRKEYSKNGMCPCFLQIRDAMRITLCDLTTN
jgi:hypothetical protein